VDAPIRVMVVDDTDHVRRMLRSMLELDGFVVVAEAASGPEAVDLAAAATPDVVVMDYRMPGMDGIDAARAVRERRPEQVIILYTAFLDEDLVRRAHDAGIAACLGKTEGLETLEREIRTVCGSLF